MLGMLGVRRVLSPSASVFGFRSMCTAHPRKLRNIAVVAHVDHGKTTLVDCLLQACGLPMSTDRVMDSMDQERERGITIMSKVTAVEYKDYLLNIVDTPGHADFGGEVERVLHMVDGVLLVVCAREGCMAQTSFVLEKALAKGLPAVVVLNKSDRPDHRLGDVENDVLDLFDRLGASDEQLEYPTLYASAKQGWAVHDVDSDEPRTDMTPLLDAIVEHVPPPTVQDASGPFKMLVTQMAHDTYIGKLALGRVTSGSVAINSTVSVLSREGDNKEQAKVTKLLARRGLNQVPVEEAVAGDIVEVAGLASAIPTDTLCAPGVEVPVDCDRIDPPTLSMCIGVNDSPLGGKEGKFLTSAMIADRLTREAITNVSLEVLAAPADEGMAESVEVRARGELQLAVLIETMRREGFELSVSPPRVVLKSDGKGTLEPYEEVTVDIDDSYAGSVIEGMSNRRGTMMDYSTMPHGDDIAARLVFLVPTRGLLGFQSHLKTVSRGTAIMTRRFRGYGDFVDLPKSNRGALVSSAKGPTTSYALAALEPRGLMYVSPGDDVYEGMIIGAHTRDNDLDVNPLKGKKLTNVRASGTDENIKLTPPRLFSLEEALTEMRPDELLEVTPSAFRLRKRHLDPNARKRAAKSVRTSAGVVLPIEDHDMLLEM